MTTAWRNSPPAEGYTIDELMIAAQLDQYGNANKPVIGNNHHVAKVSLPGTAGLADMGAIGKKVYLCYPNHSPRSVFEKVDFVRMAGRLDGGDSRGRLGRHGGPERVVSNLAVMDFHPLSKRMMLRSVHPGIRVEQVQAANGSDLSMPEEQVPEIRSHQRAAADLQESRRWLGDHRIEGRRSGLVSQSPGRAGMRNSGCPRPLPRIGLGGRRG